MMKQTAVSTASLVSSPVGEHGVRLAELRVYQPHDVLQVRLSSVLQQFKLDT